MKKLFVIFSILILCGTQFAAIGAGDLSTDAKRGWAWFFTNDYTQNYSIWEAALIVHLEAQGIEYNLQRLEANAASKEKIESIRTALRGATDEQITAILTALGL